MGVIVGVEGEADGGGAPAGKLGVHVPLTSPSFNRLCEKTGTKVKWCLSRDKDERHGV